MRRRARRAARGVRGLEVAAACARPRLAGSRNGVSGGSARPIARSATTSSHAGTRSARRPGPPARGGRARRPPMSTSATVGTTRSRSAAKTSRLTTSRPVGGARERCGARRSVRSSSRTCSSAAIAASFIVDVDVVVRELSLCEERRSGGRSRPASARGRRERARGTRPASPTGCRATPAEARTRSRRAYAAMIARRGSASARRSSSASSRSVREVLGELAREDRGRDGRAARRRRTRWLRLTTSAITTAIGIQLTLGSYCVTVSSPGVRRVFHRPTPRTPFLVGRSPGRRDPSVEAPCIDGRHADEHQEKLATRNRGYRPDAICFAIALRCMSP